MLDADIASAPTSTDEWRQSCRPDRSSSGLRHRFRQRPRYAGCRTRGGHEYCGHRSTSTASIQGSAGLVTKDRLDFEPHRSRAASLRLIERMSGGVGPVSRLRLLDRRQPQRGARFRARLVLAARGIDIGSMNLALFGGGPSSLAAYAMLRARSRRGFANAPHNLPALTEAHGSPRLVSLTAACQWPIGCGLFRKFGEAE